MQDQYNLLAREEEREMIPLCLDEGVGTIVWSPLARGRLARLLQQSDAHNATRLVVVEAFIDVIDPELMSTCGRSPSYCELIDPRKRVPAICAATQARLWPRPPPQTRLSDLVRGVRVGSSPAQFAADPLTFGTTFPTVQPSVVTQFAWAQTMSVPQPGPVTVTTSLHNIVVVGIGKVAHAVGVVVDFGTSDVATGDADLKRDVSVSTRHSEPPRVRCPSPLPLDEGRTGATV